MMNIRQLIRFTKDRLDFLSSHNSDLAMIEEEHKSINRMDDY